MGLGHYNGKVFTDRNDWETAAAITIEFNDIF
jgi:hypothetical protein